MLHREYVRKILRVRHDSSRKRMLLANPLRIMVGARGLCGHPLGFANDILKDGDRGIKAN
jgi:hypothetical protein